MEVSEETPAGQQSGIKKILSSETFLAALITIMTVLTAVTAYQASLAGGESLTNFFISQGYLTDSSLFYVEQGQELFYDHTAYNEYQLALRRDDQETADYYLDQLSTWGYEAFERSPDDPFNDAYYNALFAEAQATLDAADESYDLAVEFNVKGDRLGLVTTILAVGLAFVAWASLAPAESRQRALFSLFGFLALVLAIIEYGRIQLGM